MPYDKCNDYQKKFTRWVNHKAIFKSVAWKDYKSGERKKIINENQKMLFA